MENVKKVQAGVAFQSAAQKATRKEVDDRMLRMKTLQALLAARSANLLQQVAVRIKLTDGVRWLHIQGTAGDTVFEDLHTVSEGCGPVAKRAKLASRREKYIKTLSTASYLALLAERNELKDCYEVLNFEIQYSTGCAVESMKLHEKEAKQEKVDAVTKVALKVRGKNTRCYCQKTAVALETELPKLMALHVRLVGNAALLEACAKDA